MKPVSAAGADLATMEWKPSVCAVLNSGGAPARLSKSAAAASAIEPAIRQSPAVAAIDSPPGFPKGIIYTPKFSEDGKP